MIEAFVRTELDRYHGSSLGRWRTEEDWDSTIDALCFFQTLSEEAQEVVRIGGWPLAETVWDPWKRTDQ